MSIVKTQSGAWTGSWPRISWPYKPSVLPSMSSVLFTCPMRYPLCPVFYSQAQCAILYVQCSIHMPSVVSSMSSVLFTTQCDIHWVTASAFNQQDTTNLMVFFCISGADRKVLHSYLLLWSHSEDRSARICVSEKCISTQCMEHHGLCCSRDWVSKQSGKLSITRTRFYKLLPKFSHK